MKLISPVLLALAAIHVVTPALAHSGHLAAQSGHDHVAGGLAVLAAIATAAIAGWRVHQRKAQGV